MINPLYLCANGLIQPLQEALAKLSPKEQLRLPCVDGAGFGAVHLALANGHLDCARAAASCPALFNALNEQGQNWAATLGLHSADWPAERIGQACAFLRDAAPGQAAQAAFAAASAGNCAFIERFADAGMAKPDDLDSEGRNLLHALCSLPGDPRQEPALLRLIRLFGTSIPDASGNGPLHLACLSGNACAFRLLLDAGADPLAPGAQSRIPARICCACDRPAMLSALIALDAAPDPGDLAMAAMESPRQACLGLLASLPQTRLWTDPEGNSLARRAAALSSDSALRLLEKLGHDMDCPGPGGTSARDLARNNPAFERTPGHLAPPAASAGALSEKKQPPSPAAELNLETLARQNRELSEICLWLLRDKWIEAAGFVPCPEQIRSLLEPGARPAALCCSPPDPANACDDPALLLAGLRALPNPNASPQKRSKSF